jgi:hypothetical protein
MRYLLFIVLSLQVKAFAAQTGQTMIGDPEIGTFIIRTTLNEEPVWHPFLYSLYVKCKGEKEPRLIKSVKICRMIGHSFDQTTKTLNVRYEIGRTDSETISPCAAPETSRKKITKKNLIEECAKK